MEAILTKRDGVVSMDKSFELMCSLLKNGTYTVRIVRKTEPRTVSQNALMWMWFTCIEEATGQPKDDIHDYYCAKFLSRQVIHNNKYVWVTGGTSSLNTLQMTNFLEKVKADAATELGITLPLPEDKTYRDFVAEYRQH